MAAADRAARWEQESAREEDRQAELQQLRSQLEEARQVHVHRHTCTCTRQAELQQLRSQLEEARQVQWCRVYKPAPRGLYSFGVMLLF